MSREHRICEAITLRTYEFGEAHRIVVFLTRSDGLLRGVAYGARKSRSRFGASLEPLTHVRVSYQRREAQELAAIQNCEIIRALPAYQLSWEQSLYFSYFAELLSEFAREEVESEKLFRLTQVVLEAASRVPMALLARYFEFWLLRFEGVLPALDRMLSEQLAGKMVRILQLPPEQLVTAQVSLEEMESLEAATGKLIEDHLEKPLRSKRFLKELLNDD